MALINEIQPVLADDFIFGGILDRLPTLKIVCSEFEMSWVPGFMARLDQIEEEDQEKVVGDNAAHVFHRN